MFDEEVYVNLRIASNSRQDLKKQLIKEKVRLIALLEFPKDIKDERIDKITYLLKSATKNRVGIKKGSLAFESAENSIGIPIGLDGARYRLNLIIKNLENIQKQIDDIEIIIHEYLIQTVYSQYILSVKGIGIVIASSFLSEIGKTEISKRARPNLRNILYQEALVMVAKNEAFKEVYEYLTKRNNNRLTGKQAIVELSVRFIKVICALCTKKELYSCDKVHGLESYPKVA